jgi:hypothetical protein
LLLLIKILRTLSVLSKAKLETLEAVEEGKCKCFRSRKWSAAVFV